VIEEKDSTSGTELFNDSGVALGGAPGVGVDLSNDALSRPGRRRDDASIRRLGASKTMRPGIRDACVEI